MDQLQYLTRDGTAPQGKMKIWFTCHPDDFGSTMLLLCDELLRLQDVCIYYYNPGARIEPEERELMLSRMNLVLIPVTARLLTSASDAMDLDFPCVQSLSIPVLPILLEPGLLELYTKKFGSLQYLDRLCLDRTALAYEEKLKYFLQTVLVSDELAAEIRTAFDGTVFFSYRKKDRRHLSLCMKTLHQFSNDALAIWYDEFLLPGRDFSVSIAEKLKSCDFVALLVTPNLLEPGNYVQKTEYPMAAGKPVVAFYAVQTPKWKLLRAYPGLSRTQLQIPGLYNDALMAVEALNLPRKERTPRRLYLLGMAYLHGVDVEIDLVRAMNLLHEAAEKQEPDAIRQLLTMEARRGIHANQEEMRHWLQALCQCSTNWQETFSARQEQLVFLMEFGHHREAAREAKDFLADLDRVEPVEPKDTDLRNRLRIQGYLVLTKACEALRDQPALERCLRALLDFCNQVSEDDSGLWPLDAYNAVAKACCLFGQLDAALEAAQKRLALLQKICNNAGESNPLLRLLAQSHHLLGCIYLELDQHRQGEEHLRTALQLAERLTSHTEDPALQLLLSRICADLVGCYSVQKRYDDAQALVEQNLALCRKLVAERSTVSHLTQLQYACSLAARHWITQMNPEKATALAEEDCMLSRQLLDLLQTTDARLTAVESILVLSKFYTVLMNCPEKVTACQEEARSLLAPVPESLWTPRIRQLLQSTPTKTEASAPRTKAEILAEIRDLEAQLQISDLPFLRQELASALFTLSTCYEGPEALDPLHRCLELVRPLAAETPTVFSCSVAGFACDRLAMLQPEANGREALFLESISHLEAAWDLSSNETLLGHLLAEYEALLHCPTPALDPEACCAALERGLTLMEANGTAKQQADMALGLYNRYIALGRARRRAQRYKDAIPVFHRAAKLIETLPEHVTAFHRGFAFQQAILELGRTYRLLGHTEEAETLLSRSIKLALGLREASDTWQIHLVLIDALLERSKFYEQLGGLDAADADCEQALDLAMAAAKQWDNPLLTDAAVRCCRQMAKLSAAEGSQVQADYYEEQARKLAASSQSDT